MINQNILENVGNIRKELRNLHFLVKIGMILQEAQGTYFGVAYNAKYGICAKNKKKQLVFATKLEVMFCPYNFINFIIAKILPILVKYV